MTIRTIHQNDRTDTNAGLRKLIGATSIAATLIFGSGAFFEASADSVGAAMPSSVSVEKACSDAMELNRQTTAFDACVSSLTGSLKAEIADQQVAMERQACRVDESDRVKTAECLLRADEKNFDDASESGIVGLARQSVRQRAEACASLGIAPGTDAFRPCVDGLRSALSPDQLRMGN